MKASPALGIRGKLRAKPPEITVSELYHGRWRDDLRAVLFAERRLTTREIADLLGESVPKVREALKARGLISGSLLKGWCPQCGADFYIQRCYLRRGRGRFCSKECSNRFRAKNGSAKRDAGVTAAKAVIRVNGRKVKLGEVVEFRDGDPRNLELRNLLVFRNRLDADMWLTGHRRRPTGERIMPKWDGLMVTVGREAWERYVARLRAEGVDPNERVRRDGMIGFAASVRKRELEIKTRRERRGARRAREARPEVGTS